VDFRPEGGEDRGGSGERMTRQARRNRTPAFNATVTSAAIKGEKFSDVHPNQMTTRTAPLPQGDAGVFGSFLVHVARAENIRRLAAGGPLLNVAA
jgi:hypothetical protein